MTKAHIGSRLNLKNMVHSLPEGMILFPLDGRVYDTKNQIPVLLNTTTIREDEKKFFASIAVEDATTNLYNGNDFESGYGTCTGYNGVALLRSQENIFDGNYSLYVDTATTTTTGWRGVQIGVPSLSNGTTYTLSFYIYIVKGSPYVRIWKGSTVYHQRIVEDLGYKRGEWQRVEVTFATDSSGTTFNQYIINNSDSANFICYVDNIQLEQKDHATSFVNGSRSVGNLKYDISALGVRDAGCVSCWIYNSDSMVNNRATGGVVNNQYLIKLGSYKYNNWYDDAMTLWIENITPRKFKFWSSSTTGSSSHSSDHIQSINTVDQYGEVGSWLHFVIQWDKNGLPSGNKKEFYINGVLQGGNSTTALPNNILTYLHLGAWADNDDGLKPCTMFEQLAIHPSKGFSPEVIQNWYESQTPFFDVHDQMFVY